jgi:hypothetical protein
MTWIKQYFSTHKAVSVSAIEAEAGMPARTLHNFLNGSKDRVPSKHYPGLLAVISRYGFAWQGWAFTYDDTDKTFIAEKRIEGKEITSIEVEEEGRSHFEYQVWIYRELIPADSTEIELFFGAE